MYLGIADKYRPKWLLWENVRGVLSSNSGRDFGTFLGALVELGYGVTYRVLDAAAFGCAAPRPRVFVLGHLGGWGGPAAVLFDKESLARDFKPRRSSGQLHPCLTAKGARAFDDRTGYVLEPDGIRITTPVEHERALGFPDNYTRIPWRGKPAGECPDGPRYKALGNSMAVPVMRWIGARIQAVELFS